MKTMARGWLRRKKGLTLFCWRNEEGMEQSRSLGPADMSDQRAWAKVGELKLDKLVAQADPLHITFGQLAEKYLATYPFNKQSTKELHEQIVRKLLIPRWSDSTAIGIDPQKLKAWMVSLDIESPTRSKYKSIMSGLFTWGQCEGFIPQGEEYNPCNYVKGREFSQVSGHEAVALGIEQVFAVLAGLQQPEYELTLLIVACQLRISEALGLKWKDVLWAPGLIAIRQTFVHLKIQQGAKTRLSRSRVEAPKLDIGRLGCMA